MRSTSIRRWETAQHAAPRGNSLAAITLLIITSTGRVRGHGRPIPSVVPISRAWGKLDRGRGRIDPDGRRVGESGGGGVRIAPLAPAGPGNRRVNLRSAP